MRFERRALWLAEDAERFIEEVRGDEAEVAEKLRIEGHGRTRVRDRARVGRTAGRLNFGRTSDGPPSASTQCPNLALTQADARTRTGDPFITSEVLYQLSYVGGARILLAF